MLQGRIKRPEETLNRPKKKGKWGGSPLCKLLLTLTNSYRR